MIALRIANNMIQNNLLMTQKVQIEETEFFENHKTQYIKVEQNLNKKLTKVSSAATYDTQHTQQTHQILRASGGLDDHVIMQHSSNSALKPLAAADQTQFDTKHLTSPYNNNNNPAANPSQPLHPSA